MVNGEEKPVVPNGSSHPLRTERRAPTSAAMSTVAQEIEKPKGGFAVLWRFLPMLWPKDDAELRMRVVAAVLLVLAGKAITLAMPFAYKAVVDAMSGETAAWTAALMLVIAYAGARFGGVLADNLRNALFEKVGQNAARRLSARVFRHVHSLSLRFISNAAPEALRRLSSGGPRAST